MTDPMDFAFWVLLVSLAFASVIFLLGLFAVIYSAEHSKPKSKAYSRAYGVPNRG